MEDITAETVLKLAAQGLATAGGEVVAGNAGPGSRFGFIVIRMPDGQEYTLRAEEN